jgi:hypothetical protein
MTTQVLVYDAVVGRSWDLLYTKESMDIISNNWTSQDRLLVDLQSSGMFDGATSWDQLKPVHFKTLIARNFLHMDKLPDSELKNPKNPVAMSMSFLVGCLLLTVGQRSELDVELVKIRRVTNDSLTFDFTASLNKEHALPEEPTQDTKGLRLAVDNTKS